MIKITREIQGTYETQRSHVKHALVFQFWPAARQLPAQNFKEKHEETNAVTQNRREKIEMFMEI